jgi:AraC-like DNA-binding protein
MQSSLVATSAFEELGISASLYAGGVWRAIHLVPNVSAFEIECGGEVERWAYNDRCLARARATKRPLRSAHEGFYDLFVPVTGPAATDAVLVAGPFAIGRSTSADVVERWHRLSHTRADLADHAFSRYLSETLSTLTLEGREVAAFERVVACCALLLGGAGDPEKLAGEAEALKVGLLRARATERMWEAVRSMVDERTTRVWATPLKRDPLSGFGMERAPEHALVGLLRGRAEELDPIDETLRLRAFQRDAAELARKRGNVVCGQVGDRGVALLTAFPGTGPRARAALTDLAARAGERARRFGFRLHAGLAPAAPPQSLASRYVAALAAAERALSRGQSVAFAGDRPEPSARNLSLLRARLAERAESSPEPVLLRFEQYMEAVVVHAGHQIDVVRAYLEAAFERLAEPLLASGRLDPKSYDELCASLEDPHRRASTVTELLGAYRSAVADLAHAVKTPTTARQERSVRRGLAFVREHLGEPVTLASVARVAGFAPAYFARLLKREEKMTFDGYLQSLRLERARQLLASTTLDVRRIAERSGFKSRTYFQQVFRQRVGMTPIAYRRRGGRRSQP